VNNRSCKSWMTWIAVLLFVLLATLAFRTFHASRKASNALPWATPCVLGLMYGHSDVELNFNGEASFMEYSYSRAMQCIRESNAQNLVEECDVEAVLQDPDVQASGVTDESVASTMFRLVNRLPFVEHWLRTGGAVWQSSSLKAALRMLHEVAPIVEGRNIRVLDAGCGTGFVVSVLALMSGQLAEVVCLEYTSWLHKLGQRIAHRDNIFDVTGLQHSSARAMSKVDWVHGDATQMRAVNESSLGTFDLIVFGVSLPSGDIPRQITEALRLHGVLYGPRCTGEYERKDGSDAQYCRGQWKMYQKKRVGGKIVLEEQPAKHSFPSFFIVPF